MPALLGSTLEELKAFVRQRNLPAYHAPQIARWLYQSRATSFQEMTNLPVKTRNWLEEHSDMGLHPPLSVAVSADGTKKYLFPVQGGLVETAWIPEKNRGTLCVSTQIGCRRGCRFCMTGKQGFHGNLSAGEILNQFRSLPEFTQTTHFVFMGMGEPLDNIQEVLKALEILSADWGFGFSPRKITVSTIGILPALSTLLHASSCRLAWSLHSPFPHERATIIPQERRHSMMHVREAFLHAHLGQRRLTVEYLMIQGFNDSPAHAQELVKLLKPLGARVNLIPYHPIPEFQGAPSPPKDQLAFQKQLNRHGVLATIRRSRGMDIQAACGMLSTQAATKQRKSSRPERAPHDAPVLIPPQKSTRHRNGTPPLPAEKAGAFFPETAR